VAWTGWTRSDGVSCKGTFVTSTFCDGPLYSWNVRLDFTFVVDVWERFVVGKLCPLIVFENEEVFGRNGRCCWSIGLKIGVVMIGVDGDFVLGNWIRPPWIASLSDGSISKILLATNSNIPGRAANLSFKLSAKRARFNWRWVFCIAGAAVVSDRILCSINNWRSGRELILFFKISCV
jgi:hypothetical protein